MYEKRYNKISKSLSYWLRHNPSDIEINLTSDGWANVEELIEKTKSKIIFDFNDLKHIVDNDSKKRFSISEDMSKIKANQGHSIPVNLDLLEVLPPNVLYHGTPKKNIDSILKEGLNKGGRHDVHLSDSHEVASKVGARRGEYVVLKIEALKMSCEGNKVYVSENGVYLTDNVPAKYISI
jgi:putative RNA 2'-phosphotransferase